MRPGGIFMRLIRLLTTITFAATLAFSCAILRAQDQSTGDPVADAARKARQQKKEAPKPKKVFTNEDITPKPPEQPAPAAAPVTEAPTPSSEAKAETDKPATTK